MRGQRRRILRDRIGTKDRVEVLVAEARERAQRELARILGRGCSEVHTGQSTEQQALRSEAFEHVRELGSICRRSSRHRPRDEARQLADDVGSAARSASVRAHGSRAPQQWPARAVVKDEADALVAGYERERRFELGRA